MPTKLSRGIAIVGCLAVAATMSFASGYYVWLLAFPDTPSWQGSVGTIEVAFLVALIVVTFPWFGRTRSHDRVVFYGGGLRECKGTIWRGLRLALWGSFLLTLLHCCHLMSLPRTSRAVSPHVDLFMVAFTFYAGCFVLFGSLYGVHAIGVYRFFGEVFCGSSNSQSQRRGDKE